MSRRFEKSHEPFGCLSGATLSWILATFVLAATAGAHGQVHFPMNEGAGDTIRDVGPHGWTGRLSNSPTWYTGKGRSGLRFDPNEQQAVRLENAFDVGISDFSIGLWVEVDEMVPGAILLTLRGGDDAERGVQILIDSATDVLALADFGAPVCEARGALPTSGWHHLALAVDRQTELVLYVDGAAVSSCSISAYRSRDIGTRRPLRLGRDRDGNYFDGSLDDLRLFDRALAPSEVVALREGAFESGFGYDEDRGADDPGDVAEYGGDVYYVSPTGDDDGEGSFDSPWQSIERAIEQASYGAARGTAPAARGTAPGPKIQGVIPDGPFYRGCPSFPSIVYDSGIVMSITYTACISISRLEITTFCPCLLAPSEVGGSGPSSRA